ncbi:MAG: myo-inositol 2-dehydrogenase/D-chiro-inositol 1-dehydrogenase, partial [Candidatus Pelagisphaera sp.]
ADNQELQDNFSAILKWKGGAYAVVSQTLAAFEHHQTVKVTGTKGAIWAGWSGALDRTDRPMCFLKYFDGEIVHDLELEKQSGEIFELRSEIEMMVRCIQSGDSPVASAEDGYWSVAMCLAAQASVDQGKPIEFDSFLQSQ